MPLDNEKTIPPALLEKTYSNKVSLGFECVEAFKQTLMSWLK